MSQQEPVTTDIFGLFGTDLLVSRKGIRRWLARWAVAQVVCLPLALVNIHGALVPTYLYGLMIFGYLVGGGLFLMADWEWRVLERSDERREARKAAGTDRWWKP